MRLAYMVDSTSPIIPPPAGVEVAAFYLHAHGESQAWTLSEVEAAKAAYKYLLPIWVEYTGRYATPNQDADQAVMEAAAFGIDHGAIALDAEANKAAALHAANYPLRWGGELRLGHGRYDLGYTSRSTVYAVQGMSGIWSAGYDGLADLEGYAAHQFNNKGGGGAYDVSVIDLDQVPLFSTQLAQGDFLMAVDETSWMEVHDAVGRLELKVNALYALLQPVDGHSYLEEIHDAIARVEAGEVPKISDTLIQVLQVLQNPHGAPQLADADVKRIADMVIADLRALFLPAPAAPIPSA